MVYDLVEGAVITKMESKHRNDLISLGEYCYASGYALHTMKAPQKLFVEALECKTLKELKEKIKTFIEPKQKEYEDVHRMDTLIYMLLNCKLEGDLNEELRGLIEFGFQR
ncbi:MAG TPA: DUF3837 family protein [Candidatus Merdenecus merdavium]|nr:DUF3837 family protein [Candidatus Merdenecus merdavium]